MLGPGGSGHGIGMRANGTLQETQIRKGSPPVDWDAWEGEGIGMSDKTFCCGGTGMGPPAITCPPRSGAHGGASYRRLLVI